MMVREALMMTADRVDNPDNQYGNGIIDVMAAINYELGTTDPKEMPSSFALHPAYPNPFNPTTNIRYDLTETLKVSLVVYDMLGKKVKTLINQAVQPAGFRDIQWHGVDDNNNPVSSGVYFISLEAGRYSKTHKVILIR
jgi:hypothetical protein